MPFVDAQIEAPRSTALTIVGEDTRQQGNLQRLQAMATQQINTVKLAALHYALADAPDTLLTADLAAQAAIDEQTGLAQLDTLHYRYVIAHNITTNVLTAIKQYRYSAWTAARDAADETYAPLYYLDNRHIQRYQPRVVTTPAVLGRIMLIANKRPFTCHSAGD